MLAQSGAERREEPMLNNLQLVRNGNLRVASKFMRSESERRLLPLALVLLYACYITCRSRAKRRKKANNDVPLPPWKGNPPPTPSEKSATVASYRSRRHQIVEEVPGLYIRRLTLEDPKTARERPDTGLQSPARHVCHPRASYVPSERPTSSYRSWLEEIRRESRAVLTITSLQLPECPVPLIDSQANRRCKTAYSRDSVREETLNEIFAKVAEAKAQSLTHSVGDGKSEEDVISEAIEENYEIERCCQDIGSPEGTSSELPSYDEFDYEENISDAGCDKEEEEKATAPASFEDCMCTEISEKLRINIRKKTEVRRSPSPEVTHTIRIAMKCHGGPREARPPVMQHPGNGGRAPSDPPSCESENDPQEPPTTSCCPGVSVALDFTLNCNNVQLTSRDVTVRPIVNSPISTPPQQTIGKAIKSAKD
ncbi:hypothetical protein TSAR_007494 [Trichomalopsis sarcophagae]|uniref:Uncharacterized protein n=1 Tax=Trichomalopsis sarcophagae TaxID=543379 RepID=A0A232EMI0_9HYME|nr:hypothetical protein TSAR_007494 [Trichomalopsis sarcophagae]